MPECSAQRSSAAPATPARRRSIACSPIRSWSLSPSAPTRSRDDRRRRSTLASPVRTCRTSSPTRRHWPRTPSSSFSAWARRRRQRSTRPPAPSSSISPAGTGCALENLSPYRVGTHQHAPELAQALGFPVCFVPHLLPIRRGLLVTCYAQATEDGLRDRLDAAYATAPAVRLLDDGIVPELSR